MYFRRSLNKIVKVRPVVTQNLRFGFCRYFQTGYTRPFSHLKYNGMRNGKSPLLFSTVTRKIGSENFIKSGKENAKFVQKCRVDLMAPNFRSNYFQFKSTTKNRKQTGSFHTMPKKSLTLKMCRHRQPSKNLSTSHFKHSNAGQSIDKAEKNKEMRNIVTGSKADICRSICGPNTTILTSETNASSHPKHSERIIDKLTDAEIEEICKNRRCTCNGCHGHEKINSSHSATDKSERSSTTFQSAEKLQDSAATIQSSDKLKDSSKPIQSEDSSKPIQSEEQSKDSLTTSDKLKGPSSTIQSTGKLQHSATTVQSDPIESSSKPILLPEKLQDSSKIVQSAEKLQIPSTTIQSTGTLEGSSKTIQSAEKVQESVTTNQSAENVQASSAIIQSTGTLEGSSKTIQSAENVQASSSTIQSTAGPSTNVQSGENLPDSPTTNQSEELLKSLAIKKRNETENQNQNGDLGSQIQKMIKPKDPFITKNRKERENRNQIRNENSPKIRNSYERPTARRQYRADPRYISYGSVTIDPRKPSRIDNNIVQNNLSRPGDTFRQIPRSGAMHPMQPLPLGPVSRLKSNYERIIRPIQSKYERDIKLKPSQGFQTQIKRDINPYTGLTKNGCHFEQLKKVPFRYRPIYDKKYHSDPVIKNRSPRFDAMHLGVPYKSANQPHWHQRQKHQKMFGSENSRNRQSFNLQPSISKLNSIPITSTDKIVYHSNITPDIGKGTTLPISGNVQNMHVNKEQLVNLPNIDTAKQSKHIMSKLVENLSVVIEGPTKLKLVPSSYPRLRDEKDVIIQMEYVNLTDADTRHYLTGKYNSYSYSSTAVGRTGSGIIIETGRNVRNVRPGDKVLVKPFSCGKCSLCASDRRNICEHSTVSEMSPIQGILSRLHVHSSEFVTKIPDNVSTLNGAMTWTLSTAIRACQKADVSAGDFVLVIGGGSLGTATGIAAQLMGATTVCLADTRQPVLEEAQKLGIKEVFLIDPKSPSRNTAIKIWEQIGEYPRVTFDCRGSQLTNEIAIDTTRTGGKAVFMTNSQGGIPLDLSTVITRDIDIIISTNGNDESDIAALRFLNTNTAFFSNITDKHYDLMNVEEAFQQLHAPNRSDSQIIVKCGCKCLPSDSKEREN